MSTSTTPPGLGLAVGFTRRPPSDEKDALAEKDTATQGARTLTPISCFRSLNLELEWDELHGGWRKRRTDTYPNTTKKSDPGFLTYLANELRKETDQLPADMLHELEEGYDVVNLSSKEPEGDFYGLRVAVRFQDGLLIYQSKIQCIYAHLDRLIETDSTPGCLQRIATPQLHAKMRFLENQPVLWMQFASRRRLLLQTAQKYAILIFSNIRDRDRLQLVNHLVLHTSYLSIRKKFAAKHGERGPPAGAQLI